MPPVLACFTDQDARVRYYACEALYNIAKVAKGEILIYFNHIFDALCKVRVFAQNKCTPIASTSSARPPLVCGNRAYMRGGVLVPGHKTL